MLRRFSTCTSLCTKMLHDGVLGQAAKYVGPEASYNAVPMALVLRRRPVPLSQALRRMKFSQARAQRAARMLSTGMFHRPGAQDSRIMDARIRQGCIRGPARWFTATAGAVADPQSGSPHGFFTLAPDQIYLCTGPSICSMFSGT